MTGKESICACCNQRIVPKTIGIHLKEIREEHGLSQVAFSATIGVSPATYNAYETDKQNPRSDTIVEICKKYNVSADWLLCLPC